MRNFFEIKLRGMALPTVIVVSVLMTLTVLLLISLWETEGLLFARAHNQKVQRFNIESGFVLYETHPGILGARARADTLVDLFGKGDESSVRFRRKPWGLYEAISVFSANGRHSQTRILGVRNDFDDINFYYADSKVSLTVTGNTNLKGNVRVPAKGLIYGQMRSIFFSGEKITPSMISISDSKLPPPSGAAAENVACLFALLTDTARYPDSDSIVNPFRDSTELLLRVDSRSLYGTYISGNIILIADKIELGPKTHLNDVVVVANNIRLKKGFSGNAQFFAEDSLIVEESVMLKYPSGLYSRQYAEIGGESVANGYVIVEAKDSKDITQPNYVQSRQSKVRGLLYVSGNAQLQGIVSGQCYLNKAMYYAPEGYYKDMLYDVSILENTYTASPLWFNNSGERENIKQIR